MAFKIVRINPPAKRELATTYCPEKGQRCFTVVCRENCEHYPCTHTEKAERQPPPAQWRPAAAGRAM